MVTGGCSTCGQVKLRQSVAAFGKISSFGPRIRWPKVGPAKCGPIRTILVSMLRRRRHRRLIALLALLGVLFQQVAMATYVCPLGQDGATTSHSLPPCHQVGVADKARCHTHCHPQWASADHPPSPTVPAAILPPTTWIRSAAWQSIECPHEISCAVTARAAAPPITVQHCTFQI